MRDLLVGSCSQSLQIALIYASLRGAESQNVTCLCIVDDVSPKRSDLGQEKRCKGVSSQRPTFRLLASPSHRLLTYAILRTLCKSKIAKIIHKYGSTIPVDFNVSVFDIFAISHTLNLFFMPGFDNK